MAVNVVWNRKHTHTTKKSWCKTVDLFLKVWGRSLCVGSELVSLTLTWQLSVCHLRPLQCTHTHTQICFACATGGSGLWRRGCAALLAIFFQIVASSFQSLTNLRQVYTETRLCSTWLLCCLSPFKTKTNSFGQIILFLLRIILV